MNKRLNKYDYMTQQTYGNWNGGVYSGFSEIYKIDIQEVRQSVVQQGAIQGDKALISDTKKLYFRFFILT
jgi:hypothetical protein